jgi:group I intron endonuclease
MNSQIYKTLLKNGLENFDLEILEYCNKESVIQREQYYMDLLKPDYNILSVAGSSLGFKHTQETLLKFKDRKLSPEALANLKKAKAGVAPSSITKAKQLLATGHQISILDTRDESEQIFDSIRLASKALGITHPTLLTYVDKDKLYKGIYSIKRIQKK